LVAVNGCQEARIRRPLTRLAETEWARAFKAVSPGLLPVLGVLFALLVGFIAVEVWNTFEVGHALLKEARVLTLSMSALGGEADIPDPRSSVC
jgi:hypothetical protein